MIPAKTKTFTDMLSHIQRGLITAILLSIAGTAYCLPDDRNQAINLSSDRATYENNQGIYSGNVKMSQGSLKIEADKLVIVESNRKVEKVIAHGRPAKFEQQPREGEGVVIASANTVEYKLNDEEILLQKNASITHQGSKISGDRVVYSGKKQTVVADGGSAAENGRVKMTLQPQNPDDNANAASKTGTTKKNETSAKTNKPSTPPSNSNKATP
ncbi:lipopolysaccharide transport periplasmic protein LptA [Spongiibacter sp. IMCC21906]|jgi:lipopolysaccharide export system protein LptA|uniref:lipopolysaccharide transport periplasmic protein LptA n=1 Tax=Spongiibacter sp. IMCC21906 TaxID=1620392 RepID=UPI00062DD8CE|nr:lipopolysaccharide transport periplasmic protein LptA [Spongiibacter sp. IMCC21906]AKH68861.1 lipopolysaccharide transport periplasmic protein LptA [Spongiibacter sp. IMCC21906]